MDDDKQWKRRDLWNKNLKKQFLLKEISRRMKNDSNKIIEYIQTGLRGANDIYKRGGHVVAKYSDRSFSLEYDNKRCIIETPDELLNSVPWKDVSEYGKIRILKDTITKPVFTKGFVESQSKGYKSYIETSVRGFVKACLTNKDRYGIPVDAFKDYKSIIEFIHNYEPAREVKLSLSSLSKLKHRNTISRTVPRTAENESFIAYVQQHIKDFEADRFFKELSSEAIRSLRNASKNA